MTETFRQNIGNKSSNVQRTWPRTQSSTTAIVASSTNNVEDNSHQASSTSFVLQATIAVVEDWEQGGYREPLFQCGTLSVNNVLGVFTAMLHFQLKEIPEDFFVDIVSKNNFLTVVLQVWCMISIYLLHYLKRPLFTMSRMGIQFGFQSLCFRNSNSVTSKIRNFTFLVKAD